MRISDLNIIKFLYNSAIEKKKQELEKQNFKVYLEYRFNNVVFDLYAESETIKYVYEFKIAKNTKIDGSNSEKHFEKLQEAAKELGARLIVIYIKPPQEGVNVVFEELSDILYNDLFEKRMDVFNNLHDPSVLEVFNINILLINIEKESLYITGSFAADVDYLLSDAKSFYHNPSINDINNCYFDISFELQLNRNFDVVQSKYNIINK